MVEILERSLRGRHLVVKVIYVSRGRGTGFGVSDL
jgi:hypothetical protein